jgi:hypothetical protein
MKARHSSSVAGAPHEPERRRVAPGACGQAPADGADSVDTATLQSRPDLRMNMTLSIGPLVALIAGILILVVPRLLNFIVAIYLIIIGLLGLFGGHLKLH